MKKLSHFILACFLLLVATTAEAAGQVIDPGLEAALQSSQPNRELPVIITLAGKADLRSVTDRDRKIRRSQIATALRQHAERVQGPLRAFLQANGASRIQLLWIINGVAATLPAEAIRRLAGLPEVESIRLDETFTAPAPISPSAAPEWHINAIRAPELWSLGHTGVGAIVANMDSGVDIDHPDLAGKWRGGANSWFDPNGEHDTPYDSSGHGTQTMGLMVGGDAGGSAIGVAPGAKFVAIKIFNDAGVASLSATHRGFQWLLNPDGGIGTDDAPHVVSNSWGFANIGQCNREFENDIAALRMAGIAVVFAAGNEGPSASSSTSPANNAGAFSVGAIDEQWVIAGFSSRGLSACTGTIFPNIVAPGVRVSTSDLSFGGNGFYTTVSGTSAAAPLVAGAMALLIGAIPDVTVPELESALTESAVDLGDTGPDIAYGYGLIDAVITYARLSDSPPSGNADADGDGYPAAADCNDNDPTIYPGAPETKRDGIDQDCNGYDLTIDISRAAYSRRAALLSVQATSALAQEAQLMLVGYGPMKWASRTQLWSIVVRVPSDPGTVTVSGIEGLVSAPTSARGN